MKNPRLAALFCIALVFSISAFSSISIDEYWLAFSGFPEQHELFGVPKQDIEHYVGNSFQKGVSFFLDRGGFCSQTRQRVLLEVMQNAA